MARSSDVVKKILRFKLQLSDPAKPATVLKVLQKLKDLDVTLEVLAETGIGKTVNSLRRHKQAGELAKSLVKGWKKLVPKQSTSHGERGCLPETVSVETADNDQSFPENRHLPSDDEQNNCLMSDSKNQDTSDDDFFKTRSKNIDEETGRKSRESKNTEKSQEENLAQNVLSSTTETQDDKMEKKKKKISETLFANENVDSGPQKSRSDSREKFKSTNGSGRSASEQKSKSKSTRESSMESKDSFSSSDKPSKKLKGAKDDRSMETSTSSEAQRKKRKEAEREKHGRLKYKPDSENKECSKHKKAKVEHKHKGSDQEEPSLSFESYLNYDVNLLKRKDQSGVKKASKTVKTVAKEQTKNPDMKPPKPPAPDPEEELQDSLMHLMDVPLPAALPELEKPSSVDYYFEKKAEKEPDFCDEDSVVFTGQRLNTKMQVYSGAKTLFLPAMMSLYQQCIRTLQNNIDLLYETGGVPFELLEPVLERCTPEQLLRIEEYNPIYMGLTDHLWGKHCQRDFKECKLQEYESWKEMYIRVSEERERKLQRLTKSIVSAHSKKPKGRQVKMAFIHTVAKPPRDVRIQQEIHGTAVQQPHQLKCSVRGQENQMRPSCNEPNRSSSSGSGGSNTQDPRKKTRVAPMMAKSLKAFKKQLGRR
ncbi:elongin A, like isoform X2 [Kryptolebias marmoratus]|uniref:Elongin A, like n=1 Tax=Kryptolebias marmoratus TaxID=37003 RepID=A0A3Q3BLV9_KRYMA|nr:elongin A, like isoform X2 [Kryptolebias marmoratus]